jgi:ubiquinone/menaquinone biosynthesis C-methylase UbiE
MWDNERPTNRAVGCAAGEYDRYTAGFVAAYDALLVRRLAQESQYRQAELEVLDVGSGTARLLLQVASAHRLTRLRLTGLDYFGDMVDQARENVRACGLELRIRVVQGDVHALPFGRNTFDIVISRSTLHHFADPVEAIGEMHRVLKPGGVAIIHDLRRDSPEAAFEGFNAARAAACIAPSIRADKYTVPEVRRFAARAGISGESMIRTAPWGYASLGMELRIEKK